MSDVGQSLFGVTSDQKVKTLKTLHIKKVALMDLVLCMWINCIEL